MDPANINNPNSFYYDDDEEGTLEPVFTNDPDKALGPEGATLLLTLFVFIIAGLFLRFIYKKFYK